MSHQPPPLRPVGFFPELGALVEGMPTLEASRGGLNEKAAEAVAAYLERGIPVLDVMEATRDPFDNDSFVDGGPSLVSDGKWVWRHDLSYFVRRYAVGLPSAFVVDVLRDDPLPDPTAVMERLDEIMQIAGWSS